MQEAGQETSDSTEKTKGDYTPTSLGLLQQLVDALESQDAAHDE